MQGSPRIARKRPTLSCEPCRKRKIKCDRTFPCNHCRRIKRKTCFYKPALASTLDGFTPADTVIAADDVAHTPGQTSLKSIHGLGDSAPESLRGVKGTKTGSGTWFNTPLAGVLISNETAYLPPQREGNNETHSAAAEIPTHSSWADGHDTATPPQDNANLFPSVSSLSQPIIGAFFKNRYLGPTHPMYAWTLLPQAIAFVDEEMRSGGDNRKLFLDCKALARIVKSQRIPHPRLSCHEYGKHMPSKATADQLLDRYLRTFEPIYRVHHVPSLRKEHEDMWLDGSKFANVAHVIRIQLILAIGTCFRGDSDSSSLRSQAFRWVLEACLWASHSSDKYKMTILGLQTLCLLFLARQVVGVEADLVWLSAGYLHRIAVSMGLHIDPSNLPRMSVLESETRRRLWNTVLELCLSSSIESGTMPLVALEDFNCRLPSNFDDDQLVDDGKDGSAPRPDDTFTDTSTQIAFGRSFHLRHAIVKFMNGVNNRKDYQTVIRLTGELLSARQALQNTFQRFNDNCQGPMGFQSRLCELILDRHLLALHVPFLSAAANNPFCAYSQRIGLEVALRLMWLGLCPDSPTFENSQLATFQATEPSALCRDYIALLCSGSGPFRSIPIQCSMIIAAELQSSGGLSANDPRPALDGGSHGSRVGSALRKVELRVLLQVGVEWAQRRIRAGDTNVKDFTFLSLVLAMTDPPPSRGDGQADDAGVFLRERYGAALRRCKQIMGGLAGRESELNATSALGGDASDGGMGRAGDGAAGELSWLRDSGGSGDDDFWLGDTPDLDWDVWLDTTGLMMPDT